MNDNAASQIKKLFLENEEFRKEFITNTKAIVEKYGVAIGEDTPIEFQQTSKHDEMKPMRCVVINSSPVTNFLICDF